MAPVANDERRRRLGGAVRREVCRVDARRHGAEPRGRRLPREEGEIDVRDRQRELRLGGGARLVAPELPPLELEERPPPPAPVDLAQALPDDVLDVVLEEDHGHAGVRDVRHREEEVGDDQVHRVVGDHALNLPPQRRNAAPPEIHGVRRQPGPHEREGEPEALAFGDAVRHGDDALAVRQVDVEIARLPRPARASSAR